MTYSTQVRVYWKRCSRCGRISRPPLTSRNRIRIQRTQYSATNWLSQAPTGVLTRMEITSGIAKRKSSTPRSRFITLAAMVLLALMNRPVALARFIGMPAMGNTVTKAMAEPTPPMEKRVEKPSVSRK